MGRDASKLGMVQRMILCCARMFYLKCISELKVDSGDRFPICLLIKISSLKRQYVILSVR